MHVGEENSVLRCGQCNKPFDKQSTLKRHGYYCRSRRTGSSPRVRSCIACASRKARCDNKRPPCSRCLSKGTNCRYPGNLTKRRTEPNGDEQESPATTTHSEEVPGKLIDDDSFNHAAALDNSFMTSDLDSVVMNGNDEYLNWNDPDLDFMTILNEPIDNEMIQLQSFESPSLINNSKFYQPVQEPLEQLLSTTDFLIPRSPTSNIRSLVQKQTANGASKTTNLILHTLKSYPLMMLRHDTIPPFIHSSLISANEELDDMKPLTNCLSLVHMIRSGVHGSRKLFWKNVRMECERFRAEYAGFNKWELLAAMQALSIYILVRLQERETEHNNLDSLLMNTLVIIAKQLAKSDLTCTYTPETSWKTWLFEESRRRLVVIYRVLNILVYFDPAALCDLQTDLLLAPLPAKKQLWEASDEASWKVESQKEPALRTEFALAASGELVKLEEGEGYCGGGRLSYATVGENGIPERKFVGWEEWCEGMDGFGGLVMLVASLTG